MNVAQDSYLGHLHLAAQQRIDGRTAVHDRHGCDCDRDRDRRCVSVDAHHVGARFKPVTVCGWVLGATTALCIAEWGHYTNCSTHSTAQDSHSHHMPHATSTHERANELASARLACPFARFLGAAPPCGPQWVTAVTAVPSVFRGHLVSPSGLWALGTRQHRRPGAMGLALRGWSEGVREWGSEGMGGGELATGNGCDEV